MAGQADPERADYDALFLHVFAPALTEFMEWTLDYALKSGKKRLYFLARDGYLMHRAASRMCAERGYPLECRYLAVSRYSVRTAVYHLLSDEEILSLVCVGGLQMNFDKVMRQAGLDEAQIDALAERTGYAARRADLLNYRQIQQLKEVLRGVPECLDMIRAAAAKNYDAAMGYFAQEGLLDEVPYALVDTGWIGTLQMSLEQLLSSRKPLRLEGCYFGLYSLPERAGEGQYRGFYFEPGDHFARKALFSNSLLEAVWSAPEGMTVGYRATATGFEPLRRAEANPNAPRMERQAQLTDRYIAAYERARRELTPEQAKPLKPPTLVLSRLFRCCMERPTAAELEAFGELVFSDDLLDQSRQKVATRLTRRELSSQMPITRALILFGLRREEIHESAWLAGSVTRNGGAARSRLRFLKVYRTGFYILKNKMHKA